jgi:hypothetical protein
MRFITVITQFRDTMAMNSPSLTCCVKISYAVGHELAGSFLFHNRIYWALAFVTTNNYDSLTKLRTLEITVTTAHKQSSLFSLAAAW